MLNDMNFSKDDKLNVLNIGLMMISCVIAFILPFETFLFVYAVLGPLHYLTEISWLHDRQYFTKGKYDYLILILIALLVLLIKLGNRYEWHLPLTSEFKNKIMFLGLVGSLLLVFVKNGMMKIFGLFFILLMSNVIFKADKRDNLAFFMAVLLPTLIHVYVFTGFFLLYGALKNRSKTGLLSLAVFIICPFLLYFLFQNTVFLPVSRYGIASYQANGDGFFRNNITYLQKLFDVDFIQAKDALGNLLYYQDTLKPAIDNEKASRIIFHSKAGILLMRFIAFAYTYHYLNWFSKTEIIKWHQVPKMRFVAVIIIWVISISLYAYNYSFGMRWLYFLSLCHVLLEFPLNMISITGIGKELWLIFRNGFSPSINTRQKLSS
jgi:hypothetical protein